jgi:beta-N-acetylhexosaminidase
MIAKTCREAGVNMNMAPVLDLLINPANTEIGDRAYGSDPGLAARLGCAYIEALQAGGVIAVAKHFPGMGATVTDSHTDLPIADGVDEVAFRRYVSPYRDAAAAGLEAVMTGHIVYPGIDSLPAPLSEIVLQRWLRGEIGFQGIIISDDLSMQSIVRHYRWEDAVLRSVAAGVDILLVSDQFETQRKTRNLILDAVGDGRLTEERIDASVRRILRVKAKFGLLE